MSSGPPPTPSQLPPGTARVRYNGQPHHCFSVDADVDVRSTFGAAAFLVEEDAAEPRVVSLGSDGRPLAPLSKDATYSVFIGSSPQLRRQVTTLQGKLSAARSELQRLRDRHAKLATCVASELRHLQTLVHQTASAAAPGEAPTASPTALAAAAAVAAAVAAASANSVSDLSSDGGGDGGSDGERARNPQIAEDTASSAAAESTVGPAVAAAATAAAATASAATAAAATAAAASTMPMPPSAAAPTMPMPPSAAGPSAHHSGHLTPGPDGAWPFAPIGHLRTCFVEKNGTPRQGCVAPSSSAQLQLQLGGRLNASHSLEGLENFSHAWLVWVFHLNGNAAAKSKVTPPRVESRVGLFATRTPHRPNPIGLSLVRIERVKAGTITFSGIDLVDGTPILDVKPYVPFADGQALAADTLRVAPWLREVTTADLSPSPKPTRTRTRTRTRT